MSEIISEHGCCICHEPSDVWIPDKGATQDKVEIIGDVKRVHLILDHRCYCNKCAANWRKSKMKMKI